MVPDEIHIYEWVRSLNPGVCRDHQIMRLACWSLGAGLWDVILDGNLFLSLLLGAKGYGART